ncbi:MAG TPA: DUF4097 family beta strand repeat-containing protein [Flavitalea sp.]|nr:DUF4097 family beta strand repeat-containing protein [Flavitalea sp.]
MKPFLLSLIILASVYAQAQTFTQKVENSIREVAFIDLVANVEIRGTDGNEIMISFVSANANEHAKPNSGAGSNIMEIGLTMEKVSGKITFNGKSAKSTTGKYIIDLPARLSVNVQASADFTKSLNIKGVKGKLDIHTDHDVEIKELANNLVLMNSSGHVKILAEKKLESPVSVITESGDVDFAMFVKLGVTLKLGTGTGTVKALLSNGNNGFTTVNATKFYTSMNGGGAVIQIQSLSGNIRLSQFK